MSRINSEEEEDNVDVVVATEKRPTWDDNFAKKARGIHQHANPLCLFEVGGNITWISVAFSLIV